MSVLPLLLWKELVDALRDRRTLSMMVLLPLLLYPALMAVTGFLMAAGVARLNDEPLRVALVGQEAPALLGEVGPPRGTTYEAMTKAQAQDALREGRISAMVEVPPNARSSMEEGKQVEIQVGYTQRFDLSLEALQRVREALEGLSKRRAAERLERARLPRDFATPLLVKETDLDFEKALGPYLASRILPILLLAMLFMGALYPAIDVTAGEKERGTLETLLLAPIPPTSWMTAKYLAVFIIALLAGVLNLLSMALTLRWGLSSARGALAFSMSQGQMWTIVACLVPAAFLAAGISLAVASLARTFKDAQSLLSPVTLLATFPGLLALVPGIELNHWTAAIPLLNVALLIKATLLETVSLSQGVIALVSVLFFCAATVTWTARVFSSEAFRFGGVERFLDLFVFGRKAEGAGKIRSGD